MTLKTLRPRLALQPTARIRTLEAKAGTTPRIYGDRWMRIRRAVLLRDRYTCADCGLVRADNQIDHQVPLEQGGSADDMGNLKTRCTACHARKSAGEARARTSR